MVENLPGNAGDAGLSLDWEDSLEKEVVTHSSILAWKSQGQRSLVDCHLWGHTESDMTEVTWQQQPRVL